MIRSTVVLGLLLTIASVSPMLADTTSLQSILTNVNGVQTTNFTGYNTGGFNQTTGIGTLTFVVNGAGPSFFDVFFDHQLSLPFFNEFGAVLGGAAAGQTYEIGDSFASNIYPDVQAGGALANTNTLAGQTSNFNNACVGAACNGDFAAALGFSFTIAAGQQELITLNVSHTDPGSGLRLEDTHPVDPANSAQFLFISGSAVSQPIGVVSGVPEPASTAFLVVVLAILLVALRRRFSTNS
jgi:hypothetical protein